MEKSQGWMVIDGGEKDSKEILSLREVVFGETEKDRLEPKFWQWEFIEGPEGKAFIYVVKDGGKVIGHLADLPRQFSVCGEVVPGTFHLELMVHPDYWRKGVFYEMERYSVQHVKDENRLLMTACTVREKSINGLEKVGWKTVAKLPVLVYPIRFSGIANRYIHFMPLSLLVGGVARGIYLVLFGWKEKRKKGEIEIEKVDKLDDQFDGFWQKASSLFPIMGSRNRNYLTWRYLQHPTRNYAIYRAKKSGEMRGYIVLRNVDLLNFKSAVIVDLLAMDEEALSLLVEKGIQCSRKEGIDLLGFMVPRGHSYYKTLRRNGFLPSFKSFTFLIYPHSDRAIFLSPGKWYVSWGDTDVI